MRPAKLLARILGGVATNAGFDGSCARDRDRLRRGLEAREAIVSLRI